jgi:hypothetical protein
VEKPAGAVGKRTKLADGDPCDLPFDLCCQLLDLEPATVRNAIRDLVAVWQREQRGRPSGFPVRDAKPTKADGFVGILQPGDYNL